MKVLLLNAGSSSLKATLVDLQNDTTVAHALADWAGAVSHYKFAGTGGRETAEDVEWKGHRSAVRRFAADLARTQANGASLAGELAAVGHRIVHGGEFTESVRITPQLRDRIGALADIAPLHNPPSLETLAAAEAEFPEVPQVAIFDTAFHTTLSPEAKTYPVPRQWTEEWGLRRFGFHGLSYAYCAGRAAEMLGVPQNKLRLVICHLGHGCSATAVQNGRSVDTTMGFTPLDGLMMGTRSGSVDPGIVFHILKRHGLSAEQIEKSLYSQAGLLGVSGLSADMREILNAANAGNRDAQLALGIYTHRVRQAIGALAVTMGGLDALIFTAGVGENAAAVRRTVCEGLGCLGVEMDQNANSTCKPDTDVATSTSSVRILVIATREDVTMLREVKKVLGEKKSE